MEAKKSCGLFLQQCYGAYLLWAPLKTSLSLRGSARLNDVVGQEATEAIFQLKI